ncbi:MAG TPA: tripartite tricarboxylate transporter permease [bacterium]|nr:tripartite tricarboxylate transporter permease [bacterium]
MLEAIWHGLNLALSWPAIGLVFVAVPIGMLFGAVPGLGGNLGLALMIPFVFGMTPAAGFAFLLGMHSVVHTGGALPAILFGTPGTGPSAAAVADGYALTKQGLAARAMGAALGASLLGGIVGDMFLAALIPVVRPIVLAFGPSEIFTVALLGITLIAAVSRGSLLKGLLAGALGLALSTVGLDPQTGIGRLTFGQLWLWNGINLVTVVVGLFGLAEVIEMGWQRAAIAHAGGDPGTRYTLRGVVEGLMDVRRHAWLCMRCGLIGAFVGMIPGLGGDAASWICYGHAGQTSKHPETFGKGNVEGVIGPESANHAKEGGGLIPTVAFGVPGGSGMAILLGAFVILGLEPGPLMMIKHLDVVWAMVWILGLANVLAVAVFLAASGLIARVSFLRVSLIVPFVLVFIVLGSFLAEGAWQNMILTLGAGALGYAMKKFGYPRAPVVIGFVLGRLAETNLTLALQLWGWAFLLRPLTLLLLGLAAVSVATHVWAQIRRRRAPEGTEARPGTLLSGILTAAFGGYLGTAFGYPGLARLMPLLVGIPGVMLAGAQLALDLRGRARAARAAAEVLRQTGRELSVLWWAAGLVGLTLAFGFNASIPLFLAAFLRLRGKESWPVTVALAGSGWAFVYLVFAVGMKIFLFRGFVVRWLT